MIHHDPDREPIVLVVDDDAATLAALGRLFRTEPYLLLSTEDPLCALEWARSRKIGLIITDEFMPGMLGSELLQEVRRFSPDTATMLLTGYPRAATIFRGVQEQVDLLVAKPWEDRALRKAALRLLADRAQRIRSSDSPTSGGGAP